MPNALVADTILYANNFALQVDGDVLSMLQTISGIELGVQAIESASIGAKGERLLTRSVSTWSATGSLTLGRLAVVKVDEDRLWKWFRECTAAGALEANRKNGSIVMYSSDDQEIARYNFYKGWISKIAIGGMDVSSGQPVQETITLEYDRIERKK